MNDNKTNGLDGLFKNPTLNTVHGESAVQLLRQVLDNNWYTVDRGLRDYQEEFGPDLNQALCRLDGSGHWIDGGAGNARAQSEFAAECLREQREIPQLTSITFKYNSNAPLVSPQHRILANRRFEEISDAEIGRAQLITDFTGILNYTTELDLVLEKYMAALEPEGELFVILPPQITFVETSEGTLTLVDWLRKIFGQDFTAFTNSTGFRIRKGKQGLTIPKTRLLSAFHHHFVFRLFSEVP